MDSFEFVISMKCSIYIMSYLWNVPSIKCLIYDMSIFAISFYDMTRQQFYTFFSFQFCQHFKCINIISWKKRKEIGPRFFFKGTVGVISSDPLCKDGNYWFTMAPLKTLSEPEFYEFEPRLKSAKNRFQLSAGLNLEILNTILSGTIIIWSAAQIL